MNRLSPALLLALCVLSSGCPKKVDTQNVAGTDDEQLDQYSAQLEELHARASAGEPKCEDWCSMSKRTCDISRNVCEIAKRHVDRPDVQSKCVSSQEDCAKFNDSCSSCQGR